MLSRSGWAHWPTTRPSLTCTMVTASHSTRRPVDDLIFSGFEIGPRLDHVFHVVVERDRIADRPGRQAHADLGVAGDVDDVAHVAKVVRAQAGLPATDHLECSRHANRLDCANALSSPAHGG